MNDIQSIPQRLNNVKWIHFERSDGSSVAILYFHPDTADTPLYRHSPHNTAEEGLAAFLWPKKNFGATQCRNPNIASNRLL